jgi:phosphatidylethanolamine/phosphatidyl-N-methylethanolamine N-methyltransferase
MKTKDIYDKGASIYEETMKKYWHVPRKEFVESLEINPGERVLSCVVGTGLDLPHFPAGCYVTGIDLSEKMLNEAKKKNFKAWVELKIMDAQFLDFPDNFFDGAVLSFTLCVLENPVKALKEVIRVTKPGARVFILDYCKSRNPETEKWQELINYHSKNIGFPQDVIAWDSLMDYDKLIYNSDLPLEVEYDYRTESENPFSTACKIKLINKK